MDVIPTSTVKYNRSLQYDPDALINAGDEGRVGPPEEHGFEIEKFDTECGWGSKCTATKQPHIAEPTLEIEPILINYASARRESPWRLPSQCSAQLNPHMLINYIFTPRNAVRVRTLLIDKGLVHTNGDVMFETTVQRTISEVFGNNKQLVESFFNFCLDYNETPVINTPSIIEAILQTNQLFVTKLEGAIKRTFANNVREALKRSSDRNELPLIPRECKPPSPRSELKSCRLEKMVLPRDAATYKAFCANVLTAGQKPDCGSVTNQSPDSFLLTPCLDVPKKLAL